MPKRIYWHVLDADSDSLAFVRAAATELRSRLAAPPVDLDLDFDPLPHTLAAEIAPSLDSGHLDGTLDAIRRLPAADPALDAFGVIVYCSADAPAARAARRLLQHAVWGINLSGKVSLSYGGPNKFIFWHETLHLLGAQDHYAPGDFRTTCELPTCLMQYAPHEQTVGDAPMICGQTRTILMRTLIA